MRVAADERYVAPASVYDVPCRKCGAGPGDGCWSLRRGTCEATMYPHFERKNDYREARHGR